VNFPLNVYAPAFICACAVSCVALPAWRALCRRIGLVDDPGHRKIHEAPVPLAGGFSVLTGMVLTLLAGAAMVRWNFPRLGIADALLSHGLAVRRLELAAIVAGAFGIVILGCLDDKYELRPVSKFGGQLFIAALVAAANVRITLFVHNLMFSYAVTMLWILTVINAFNFMDNMNGLCAGLGALCAWFFAVIAAIQGQYLVALVGLVICGSLLGFLPYNFPKASAFLGDTGSHLIGYLLAVMAILPHFYSRRYPHPLAVLIPFLVLAVPLGDLVWVVCLRRRLRRPFYLGDNNHLSHRLVKRGWSRPGAVLLIWLFATVLGAVAVLLVLF
jgi:UDP-GlcNAc:undecaprenyl-phosphate/decaprenyl-phosphate GlcNAc-1-phosphate transferase